MKRGKETNFDKASEQQVLDQFPYDYTSVTHYALRVTIFITSSSLFPIKWSTLLIVKVNLVKDITIQASFSDV